MRVGDMLPTDECDLLHYRNDNQYLMSTVLSPNIDPSVPCFNNKSAFFRDLLVGLLVIRAWRK